uniref:Uncharacterized protein n=1 Tax=Lactuca sativa TaxID=4236 RepID=A0A9R1X7A2_LACSA|nr:hypothetical protein LSAT_V11C600341760 [Lactuca sativa]
MREVEPSRVRTQIEKYTVRFHELEKLVPHMLTPEEKQIDRYLWGLAHEIRGMVIAVNPSAIQSAEPRTRKTLVARESQQIKERRSLKASQGGTRKSEETLWYEPKSKNRFMETHERKHYTGLHPKCNKCNFYHEAACPVCRRCNYTCHFPKHCKLNKDRSTDHLRNACPKLIRGPSNNKQEQARQNFQGNHGGRARGVVVVIGAEEARADRSFVSLALRPLIDLKSRKMRNTYAIELADGYEIRANEIIPRMHWLFKNKADIGCYEKFIRIPLPNGETLIIHGEKPGRSLKIVSNMMIHMYQKKDLIAFMTHVVEREPEAKQIKEIPVVQDYPEVFLEELPGLLPHRQVEFRINLIP